MLHEERLKGRAGQPRSFATRPRRLHSRRFEDLPDGAFTVIEGAAWLVHNLRGLEQTLVEFDEDDGQTLLTGLLARSEAPFLVHLVRSMVGMDRAAAQEVFSEFLSNRSLTTPQIRFIEMVIDQLTVRGVMEPSALCEAPFSSVHAGGPESLFAGKSNVIDGIFEKLKALDPEPLADAG